MRRLAPATALTSQCSNVSAVHDPDYEQPRAHDLLQALAMGGFAIGQRIRDFEPAAVHRTRPRRERATSGYVVSIYALGVIIGAPVLAELSARTRYWRLLLSLMLLCAGGNGLSALAPTYRWRLDKPIGGLPTHDEMPLLS